MMNWFTKPRTEPDAGPSDVELIRTKMAACDAEIAEAEEAFSRVSLEAALSEDRTIGQAEFGRLTALRRRKDLLSDGLRAALEAEREAAGRLNEREFQARRRALAQKLGELARNHAAVTVALTQVRDAFRKLAATGEAITALLPQMMRGSTAGFEPTLTPAGLRKLCEIEAIRLNEARPGVAAPGADRTLLLSRNEDDWKIAPIAKTLDQLSNSLRRRFDECGPVPTSQRQPISLPE